MLIEIVSALSPAAASGQDRLEDIRRLFTEYTEWLGVDLAFQNYQAELAGLPGKYAEPDGRLYLALLNGQAVGCVGLRRFDAERCEMKRLFVREEARGHGLARLLAERIIADAEASGYRSMVLDTMSTMQAALALYRKLGFVEIEPYYRNPYQGIVYLEKRLGNSALPAH